MGGDSHGGEDLRSAEVSIHAPAWGATEIMATTDEKFLFQSTPPHGGRLISEGSESGYEVSIHAPAWGATLEQTMRNLWNRVFQSTPPHGGRRRRPDMG